MKRYGRAAASIVPRPLVTAALRVAAVAPPSVKTMLFHRICAALARQHAGDATPLIRTNLGISAGLRCDIPLAKFAHVFGRPEHSVSERSTLALVALLSAECEHFVDVGANEGVFTFVVSQSSQSDATIHWFEPDDELFSRMERNLLLNRIASHGNKMAVSASCGVATFYKNLTDDLSGSLGAFFTHKHQTREELVKTTSLSDYFIHNQMDQALVKVDVEGRASDVWEGTRTVAQNIKYLVMEIIEPDAGAELPARIIADTGWHAYYMRDFDLVPSSDGRFDYVEPFWNWLFCRMGPADLAQKLTNTRFRVCRAN